MSQEKEGIYISYWHMIKHAYLNSNSRRRWIWKSCDAEWSEKNKQKFTVWFYSLLQNQHKPVNCDKAERLNENCKHPWHFKLTPDICSWIFFYLMAILVIHPAAKRDRTRDGWGPSPVSGRAIKPAAWHPPPHRGPPLAPCTFSSSFVVVCGVEIC